MGFTDKIDMILSGKGKAEVRRNGVLAILVFLIFDCACVVLMREAPSLAPEHGLNLPPAEWTASALLSALPLFADDTVDVLLLFVVRVIVLFGLTWLAVRVGTPDLESVKKKGDSSAVEPLLINGAGPSTTGACACGAAHPPSNGGPAAPTTAVKKEHLDSYELKQDAERRKNLVIAAVFISSTTAQAFVGIKCIGYRGGWHDHPVVMTVQGTLMGLSVLFINVEAWITKRVINALTKEEGFYVPEFHPHPLFFATGNHHRCDMCRSMSKQYYRCGVCDFDCCPQCFNKKDKATGEGMLRGDKGLKDIKKLTNTQYLWRGIRLAGPHIPLFLLALLCLTAQSMINLFLPNFQGKILDHVIAGRTNCVPASAPPPPPEGGAPMVEGGPLDGLQPVGLVEMLQVAAGVGVAPTAPALPPPPPPPLPSSAECVDARHAFLDTVTLYLILSICTGALGGLRALCFNLVGRRIMVWLRCRLFRCIITQDIAFFDGMRTGDLTQRLTGDVRAMVSPIQSVLSSTISNMILLVGGVVMCFVTSWRLSMVAYTTVLPIMHITETYATWSGNINRQIFQHFSDGAAVATEAVTNVRTVRAVSSEEAEIEKYDETMQKALKKGIRDATVGALTTSFNNYLDLGAGVLLLWYGGSIAMSPDGASVLTVGSLIKYQLYWNMINNSYQALNNVLNQFTRAAGAAERVLSLVDMEPDIDPFAGAPVESAVRGGWDVRFEGVEFVYQMRPLKQVLRGVSFSIDAGTVCALVGKSGGGKSTMIHLLLRFYDPTAGCITLGGVDYRDLNLRSVHERIGVVTQETQLFNCTVGENIGYGAGEYTHEDLVAAATAAQAHQFISEFEDGYETRVGERGQRLSGGQKQRLAIARCLLRKPRLLLLDEATSALDTESEAFVQKALDKLIWEGEHTVVLVAHRLSTVVNAHKIVVLDQGRVVEQGVHNDLLSQGGAYASLVAHQLQKQREEIEGQ